MLLVNNHNVPYIFKVHIFSYLNIFIYYFRFNKGQMINTSLYVIEYACILKTLAMNEGLMH